MQPLDQQPVDFLIRRVWMQSAERLAADGDSSGPEVKRRLKALRKTCVVGHHQIVNASRGQKQKGRPGFLLPPFVIRYSLFVLRYCCEDVAFDFSAIFLLMASIVFVARKSTIFRASSVFFFRSATLTPLIVALPALTRAS